MTNRLDHVAIFVRKLEDGIDFYRSVVGLGEPIVRDIPELQIRCAFFDPGVGGTIVELVEFSGQGDPADLVFTGEEANTLAPAPYALNAPNLGKLAYVPERPRLAVSVTPYPNPVIVIVAGTLNLMCIA